MPAKKITKKVVKKTAPKKTSVEAKAKVFAKNMEKEAKVLTEEGKVIGSKIGNRRERSSSEEKVFTIIGIILLVRGVYQLKELVWGGILIVIGILFVTGFFVKKRK